MVCSEKTINPHLLLLEKLISVGDFAVVDVWVQINKKLRLDNFPQQELPIRFLNEVLVTVHSYWCWQNDGTFCNIILLLQRYKVAVRQLL